MIVRENVLLCNNREFIKDGIHVTTATLVNVNGTYHSLTGENNIGDMRGH